MTSNSPSQNICHENGPLLRSQETRPDERIILLVKRIQILFLFFFYFEEYMLFHEGWGYNVYFKNNLLVYVILLTIKILNKIKITCYFHILTWLSKWQESRPTLKGMTLFGVSRNKSHTANLNSIHFHQVVNMCLFQFTSFKSWGLKCEPKIYMSLKSCWQMDPKTNFNRKKMAWHLTEETTYF